MAKKKTFEESLKQLEDIVQQMETGDLSLEDAIEKYENGIGHLNYCLEILNNTEKKISILKEKQDGTFIEKKFENE